MWRSLLIVLVLILPPALFVAYFAGGIWYMRDHAIFERTRTQNPRYFVGLREYEAVGGIIGALPGLAILLTLKGQEKKAERAEQRLRQVEQDDETVWPPPPRDVA